MLDPEGRQLLLDALRPPLGYELDSALGTTYSLDLTALLLAPLAFAFFDWEVAEGDRDPNPLALLESVRTYSEKLTIFCQAGQIAWPGEYRHLLSYLEQSVCEVTSPAPGRVFHPKVWLLRFRSHTGEAPRFRLLCLSRNLTFARSWDTILRLEGTLAGTRERRSALAHFVSSLPALAVQPLTDERAAGIRALATELRGVRFEPPPSFESVSFWPLGLGRAWPFEGRIDRLFVTSPFLSPGLLDRLAPKASKRILLSRPESLDAVGGSALAAFEPLYVLHEGADGSIESEGNAATTADEQVAERADRVLRGLHAKLYLAEAGRKVRLWTGSANATAAAFGGNIEFLVELVGRRADFGIDTLVGEDAALRRLLHTHVPSEEPSDATAEEELDRRLERVQRMLAGHALTARVSARSDGDFGLELRAQEILGDWEGVSATVRPITLPPRATKPLGGETLALGFEPISFEALTPFFAFELRVQEQGISRSTRFVVTSRLLGAPGDRGARLFAMQLRSAGDVVRYLLFLLGNGTTEVDELSESLIAGDGAPVSSEFQHLGLPLLESLLRTLAREPERLEWVARAIADLGETEDGRKLIPSDLREIWEPIDEARRRTR